MKICGILSPEPSTGALHLRYSCMEHQQKPDPDTRAPVTLTSDVVFKYVFGSEQSTTILRSLLSAVQEDAGYAPVASVEIRNPFNEKDAEEAKLSYVDVRARDITGNIYSAEMQAYNHQGFFSRVLYYWAKAYGDQLAEGDLYTKLRPVVSVDFLNLPMFAARFAGAGTGGRTPGIGGAPRGGGRQADGTPAKPGAPERGRRPQRDFDRMRLISYFLT